MKWFPVHIMKEYWETRGTASVILKLGTRKRLAVRFTPLATLLPVKKAPVPIEQEVGWAPEPVWTFWRRQKSLVPAGN